MGDDRGAAMQLGDRAQIDRKHELHVLPLAQPQIRGLDEDARCTQIDRTAEAAATSRKSDVVRGAGAVPGV